MADFSAIAKWPNVPACYEWLSLDRRGDWRLQGERVTHRGLIDFLNKQYASDESGCWFVQNGPQRVFVALACTPWVFRRQGHGLAAHTGEPVASLIAIYLDEEGSILLETNLGIGLLDDRDLPAFIEECKTPSLAIAPEEAFTALMSGQATDISWNDLRLQAITTAELPRRFGFIPNPSP